MPEEPDVSLAEPPDERELLLGDLPQEHLGEDGHDRERDREGDEEGDQHRRRERGEHLPLDPLEREEGHQDDRDDDHGEGDRPRDLGERTGDDAPPVLLRRLEREVAADVLDDDDGGVDDHPDREREAAQAHEVRGDPGRAHDDEADEEREREGEDDDERRPELGDEEEEDQDHEEAAFEQGVDDGLDAGLDERGAVVEDVQPDSRRKRVPNLLHGGLDAAHDVLRVRALEHDDHARDDLALPVARDGALAGLRPDDDVGDVPHVDGRAVDGLEHGPLDVGNVLQEPDAPHVELLPAPDEDAPARVRVPLLDRLDDLADRQVVLEELLRRDEDLVLLHLAAEAVDLVHAGDRLQERRDDPVLDRPEVHGAPAVRLEGVLVDLPEAGRDRPELRLDARRKLLAGHAEPLEDDLARPVGVDAVLEDDDDLGEAGPRQRPDLLDARQTAHHLLDGIAHPLLDVDGGEPRSLREDHDLGVRHVGEGVDGEAGPGDDAQRGEERGAEEDEEPVLQEDAGEPHVVPSRQSAQPAPIFERRTSDFMRKAPSATTTWPAVSPLFTSAQPPQVRPTATGRRT